MGITDTLSRHYQCDYPGCTEQGTNPRDDAFVCVTVDAGEAELVYRAVLCRLRHASPMHDLLTGHGFRKVRR